MLNMDPLIILVDMLIQQGNSVIIFERWYENTFMDLPTFKLIKMSCNYVSVFQIEQQPRTLAWIYEESCTLGLSQ